METAATIQDHLTNLSRKELIEYARNNNLKTIEGLLPDQQIKILKSMDEDQIRDEIRRVETLKAALSTATPTEASETVETTETETAIADEPLTEVILVETISAAPEDIATIPETDPKESAVPESVPAVTAPKESKPGVIAFIIQILTEAAPNGISDADGKKKLADLFPDRKPEAVANTYKLQVPKRLKKEKGLNVVSGPNGYYIAPAVPIQPAQAQEVVAVETIVETPMTEESIPAADVTSEVGEALNE